ncbi:phosphotransferase enzyme family protein [Elsinoe ampelina]|uniref:Phosphotransferase enzyme family protein n=1 Tax=Elsinoe ampelina TaxID=302913 RepID=A0A6A6GRH4_9PEZI|nr:phosphotransferase enzyme family protein [Elsinoe ampelina]
MCSLRPFLWTNRLLSVRRLEHFMTQRRLMASQAENREELFEFTRGRFISNDTLESSKRSARFDVGALCEIAARAVGSESCSEIKKLPDGMYNRALLLTMNDAKQVIVKIPNPNAGPPQLTTASEVATMQFMRTKLKTPVPRVLSWSAKKTNPVGAEYIIMENAKGTELEFVWHTLNIKQRLAVVKQLASYQSVWASVRVSGYGSLYFRGAAPDHAKAPFRLLDKTGVEQCDEDYELGPIVGREWYDDRRNEVSFDRGPWLSLEDYHRAVGTRERSCVESLDSLPPSPIALRGPGLYMSGREHKLRAIDVYMKTFKHILTSEDSITHGSIWHGDLHAGNIFVDSADPTKITSLIDWQGTEIVPLYIHARQPYLIDYEGPETKGLERPVLPPDLSDMTPDEQYAARQLHLKQTLCALYRTLVHQICPPIYRSMEYQDSEQFSVLLLARNLLVDGEAAYLAQAIELNDNWDKIATDNSPSPLSFTKEEIDAIMKDLKAWKRACQVMSDVRAVIPELYPGKGIVRHEDYEASLEALEDLKGQIINDFAASEEERQMWISLWPFEQLPRHRGG